MPWLNEVTVSVQAATAKLNAVNIPVRRVNNRRSSRAQILRIGDRPSSVGPFVSRLRLCLIFGLSVCALTVFHTDTVRAQGLSGQQSPLEILQQSVLERLGQTPAGPTTTDQRVRSPIDSPFSNRRFEDGFRVDIPDEPESRIEADYKERLKRRAPTFAKPAPQQFGYELLGGLQMVDPTATGGAINGNYILGIGDELVVTFRGQVNRSYRTAVDREGQIILPDMPPVPAAGLPFKQFRAELARRTRDVFSNTEVFASLGQVRNFPVLVVGQVKRPGIHRVTGIASILDAIASAGGLQKSGSLRNVQLVRRGRVIRIDLYDLLLTGQLTQDISLMEGDRVFVPSLGKTVGVIGDVQRPGIYELSSRSPKIAARQALDLAGGTLRPEGYRYLVISAQANGGDTVREVRDIRGMSVGPGDILLVSKRTYGWTGAFFLDGHVAVPGPRSLTQNDTIGSVVNTKGVFLDDPYTLFAVLERSDPKTQARHFMAVDLDRIRSRKGDARLQANDRLIVLSATDIAFLSSEKVQAVLDGRARRQSNILNAIPTADGTIDPTAQPILGQTSLSETLPQTSLLDQTGTTTDPDEEVIPQCRSLSALAAVISRSRTERYAGAKLALNPEKLDAIPVDEECPEIYDRHPNLLPFMLDYAVAITGEVRRPGVYPVPRNTKLASLIPVVGGLSLDADLTQIEMTKFNGRSSSEQAKQVHSRINARNGSLVKVSLSPGDIVRFNPKFSQRDVGTVFLSGEFRRPGVYAIKRGEKLSDVIVRAGGVTAEAYPLGAVFTRVRVKKQEQKAFERAALDLQSGLAEALASQASNRQRSDPEGLVLAVRELANTIRQTEAIGRVVVEADPTVLEVKPQLDTVLEAGDRLVMPKRPNHVTVSGEVLSPGAIQFRAGDTVDKYIKSAGGVSRVSDDGRTFVVFPNGEARPVSVSSWNFTSVQIPPGSTIVVPRDPKPFDTMAFTISIADILSKLAITAASVAVIGRD